KGARASFHRLADFAGGTKGHRRLQDRRRRIVLSKRERSERVMRGGATACFLVIGVTAMSASSRADTIQLYAAGSLRAALTEIANSFEAETGDPSSRVPGGPRPRPYAEPVRRSGVVHSLAEAHMKVAGRFISTTAAMAFAACFFAPGVVAQPTSDALGELLVGQAAFGDWRTDAPLVRRKITDLPAPYATR